MPLDIPPSILAEGDRPGLEDAATELYEWLSLIRLGSPRVEAKDEIDPYLSRYRVPGETNSETTVCKFSWQGFIATSWLRGLLTDILTTCPSSAWVALSATCFSLSVAGSSMELTLHRPPDAAGKYLMWEIRSSD